MGYYCRTPPLGPKGWVAVGVFMALGTGIVIGGQNVETHPAFPASNGSFSSQAAVPPSTVTVTVQAPVRPQVKREAATQARKAVETSKAQPKPEQATSSPAVKPADSAVTAVCKDGWQSKSTSRSGTCSGHGGVAEWL